ncbi:MAG TPA: trypsin-like serine protease [Pyrinomonadaceae bacterium]|nr:trypsin-like serine protease [Pyrinomonadaceae bacterium]
MRKRVSRNTSRGDHPTPLHEVMSWDDIQPTAPMPKKIAERMQNYLYVETQGKQPPEIEAVKGSGNVSTWRIPLEEKMTKGRLGRFVHQTTPAEMKKKVDAPDSLDSYRPPWATQTFFPRLAPPSEQRWLRRRNGNPVKPAFVYGNYDNRVVINPTSYPWYLVGTLNVEVAGAFLGHGTGALVGTNVVLTASHVFPWFAFLSGLPWRVTFVAGSYDGVPIMPGMQSDVDGIWGYADYSQGDDMAVLRLHEPLGETLGFFGYKKYRDDWEDVARWTHIGYPDAYANGRRPTWQGGIIVYDDDSDGEGVELENTADITSGNSGGPLYGYWDHSPRVIGTMSGWETNPLEGSNNVAAGGSALSRLIKWGRDNW